MLDFLNNIKGSLRTSLGLNNEEDGFKQVWDKTADLRSKIGNTQKWISDTLFTGESDEFRSLGSKYEPILKQKNDELLRRFQDGKIDENKFKDEFFKNPLERFQKDIDGNPELGNYLKQKQEVATNKMLNSIEIGGVGTKFSGKTRSLLSKIAKSDKTDDILKSLTKFKISDDVAKKLAPQMVNVTDEQVVYRMARAGEVITDLEKQAKVALGKDMRQKIASSINQITKTTFDKNTEDLAIKKFSQDFLDGFKGEASSVKNKAAGIFRRIYLQSIGNEDFMYGENAKDIEKTIIKDGKLNPALVQGRLQDVAQKLEKEGLDAEAYLSKFEGKSFKDYFEFDTFNRNVFSEMMPDGSLKETAKKVVKDQQGTLREKLINKALEVEQKLKLGTKTPDEMTQLENTKTQLDDFVKKIDQGKLTPDENLTANEILKLDEVAKTAKVEVKEIAKSQAELEATQRAERVAKEAAEKKANVESVKKSLGIAKKATGDILENTKTAIRKTTSQFKDDKILVSEKKLLTEKFRTMSSAAKQGARSALENVRELRTQVRNYASDLPKPVQRKILSQVKFSEIKTTQHLNDVLGTVDRYRTAVAKEIDRREVLREVLPLWKTIREKGKSGFIKADVKGLGLVNKDGKPFENIYEAVKRLPKEKLQALKQGIMEALDTTPKQIDYSGIDFTKVNVGSSNGISRWKKIKQATEKGLGIASTNVRKYGGDELFYAIRRRRYEINRLGMEAKKNIEGLVDGMTKVRGKLFGKGKADYEKMSYALFNQDFNTAREIAKKHKFEGGLDNVIKVLDDIHKRANEVGLKVGKMENYFPRIVKDYEGLFAAYNKKFGKGDRSYIDKILTEYANTKFKKVGELTLDERGEALTNSLRGYGAGKINIGSVNKARKFNTIPAEFMDFYHSPEESLVMYVSKMNERITLKKLFGLEGNELDSIGGMVDGLNISPNEAYRLKEALGSILSPQGKENWGLNKLRKTATLTLLSHISSALTQFGDVGLNMYEHGVGKSLASWFRSKPFKRDELFTEIAHEFSDSNVIKKSLKAVGFDRIDRLNNEAYMGNAFRKAVGIAKKGKGSSFDEMMDYVRPMLRNDEAKIGQFLDDLKNKRITDDTRFYVFNKVLDVNPRALEEMPEAYLKHPNARFMYSMKSYGLKVLDVYRNDSLRKWKTNKTTSAKNFVKLTGILTASGATVDQIRDWYNGKDEKFSGKIFNNMLKLVMLSQWDMTNVERDGLGRVLFAKMLPPTRLMDDISKDLRSAGDGKGLYSVRNIPVIGGEIYNRVGRGRESIEKANAESTKIQKLKKPKKFKKLKTLKTLN